jgi:hypothetical protein
MLELTWKDVLLSDKEYVIIDSYGYVEKSFVSSHFEPFRTKRSFKFKIDRKYKSLEHRWLFLEEHESKLTFIKLDDGEIHVDDPDLWARP